MLMADKLIIHMRIDFVITEMWLKINSTYHKLSVSLSLSLSFSDRVCVCSSG